MFLFFEIKYFPCDYKIPLYIPYREFAGHCRVLPHATVEEGTLDTSGSCPF